MSSVDSAPAPSPGGAVGRVEVAPHAIATVARTAVMGCYGVVGLAPARRGRRLLGRLSRQGAVDGVAVRLEEGEIVLTLHLIVEYGVRISEVARNVMQSVAFAVEKALGMTVREVNVCIDDLHITREP